MILNWKERKTNKINYNSCNTKGDNGIEKILRNKIMKFIAGCTMLTNRVSYGLEAACGCQRLLKIQQEDRRR